jgi:hypothetical protein
MAGEARGCSERDRSRTGKSFLAPIKIERGGSPQC